MFYTVIIKQVFHNYDIPLDMYIYKPIHYHIIHIMTLPKIIHISPIIHSYFIIFYYRILFYLSHTICILLEVIRLFIYSPTYYMYSYLNVCTSCFMKVLDTTVRIYPYSFPRRVRKCKIVLNEPRSPYMAICAVALGICAVALVYLLRS